MRASKRNLKINSRLAYEMSEVELFIGNNLPPMTPI